MGTSTWEDKGNYTASAKAVYTVGTSKVTFTTNNATIRCSGNTPFYDLEINASGKTITLGDALGCANLTFRAGTFNQAAKAITIGTRNCTLLGAGTINGAWTIASNFYIGVGCTCVFTGSTFSFANATSIWNTAPPPNDELKYRYYKGPGSIIYTADKVEVVETNRINNPKAVCSNFQEPALF